MHVKFAPETVTPIKSPQARYAKVEIEGLKLCPSWHHGANGPRKFLIDEVNIRQTATCNSGKTWMLYVNRSLSFEILCLFRLNDVYLQEIPERSL